MSTDIKFKRETADMTPQECAAMRESMLDEVWSDWGRTVHRHMVSDRFIVAINRIGLKAKNHKDLARMLRAYLITGAMP